MCGVEGLLDDRQHHDPLTQRVPVPIQNDLGGTNDLPHHQLFNFVCLRTVGSAEPMRYTQDFGIFPVDANLELHIIIAHPHLRGPKALH